jgi:hypothetical protein
MVISLMTRLHARLASQTAKFAVMEPAVTHVKLVGKKALTPVTPVKLIISLMAAIARNAP